MVFWQKNRERQNKHLFLLLLLLLLLFIIFLFLLLVVFVVLLQRIIDRQPNCPTKQPGRKRSASHWDKLLCQHFWGTIHGKREKRCLQQHHRYPHIAAHKGMPTHLLAHARTDARMHAHTHKRRCTQMHTFETVRSSPDLRKEPPSKEVACFINRLARCWRLFSSFFCSHFVSYFFSTFFTSSRMSWAKTQKTVLRLQAFTSIIQKQFKWASVVRCAVVDGAKPTSWPKKPTKVAPHGPQEYFLTTTKSQVSMGPGLGSADRCILAWARASLASGPPCWIKKCNGLQRVRTPHHSRCHWALTADWRYWRFHIFFKLPCWIHAQDIEGVFVFPSFLLIQDTDGVHDRISFYFDKHISFFSHSCLKKNQIISFS